MDIKSPRKLYFLGIISIGLSKVLTQGTPIVILALFSKIITTEELGFLSTIIAIITMLSVMSDLGLSDTISKFAGADKKLISPIIFWEIVVTVLFGIGVFLVDIVSRIFKGYGFLFMLTVIASSFNVILMAFNGLLRTVEAGIYQFFSSIIFLVFLYLFYVFWNDPIQSVLLARLLSWGSFSTMMIYILGRENILHSAIRLPRKVVKFSMDALWFAFTELFIAQADVIFVTIVLGSLEAGIYKPATLLGALPMVLGILISTPLVPILVKTLNENGFNKARSFVYKISGLVLLLCTVGIIVALFTGKWILEVVYSQEISEKGFTVFMLFLAATCVYVVTMPLTDLLMSVEKSSAVRNAAILRLVVFIFAGIPGLQAFGIDWFGILFMLVYSVSAFIYMYYLHFSKLETKVYL